MKKNICILLAFLILILGGITGSALLLGNKVVNNFITKSRTDGSVNIPYEFLEANGVNYEEFVDKYRARRLNIHSTYGRHEIPCDILCTNVPEGAYRTVIMVHGFGENKFYMYPIAKVFLEKGYNVLVYDQRNSGESTAKRTTYGHLEKFDLMDCINHIVSKGIGESVGLWGQSLGAAAICASMKYPSFLDNVDFVILEAPVSNMTDLLAKAMDEKRSIFPTKLQLACGSFANGLKNDFFFSDCDMTRYMSKAEVPLLVVASEADEEIPAYMATEILEAYPGTRKELWTVTDSAHNEIWKDHEEEYTEKLEKIVDEILAVLPPSTRKPPVITLTPTPVPEVPEETRDNLVMMEPVTASEETTETTEPTEE